MLQVLLSNPSRDVLPKNTPWWGVILARVLTLLARAAATIAVAWALHELGAPWGWWTS